MRNHEWSDVHDVVIEAAGAMFESVGLPVAYAGMVHHGQAEWGEMVSVIGLGGNTLRGTLSVSLSFALLRRFHPAGETTESDLTDWLSELSNLVLGRIKARLLTRGVRVDLSTPVTLVASEFRLLRFGSAPLVHRFEFEGESVLVGFESIAQADARLKTPVPGGPPFDAGELVMF